MAKNRASLVEQPPPAETTEEEVSEEEEDEDDNEEGESSSSSEEEEDDDEEEEEEEPKKSQQVTIVKPRNGTASGSESESDDEPVTPKKQLPIAKPVAAATKVVEKNPKKAGKVSTPSPSPSPMKRPAEGGDRDGKEAKRGKKENNGVIEGETSKGVSGVEESGKKLFQRLWSEEDEIVILEGIIDYVTKKGENPYSDMDSFFEFIRESIHISVSKSQMLEKVRRLKKKYENNAKRSKQGGERTFSKVHEQKSYDLSKKIWGSEGVVTFLEQQQAKVNGTAKKNQSGGGKSLLAVKEELGLSSQEEDRKGKVNLESESGSVRVATLGDQLVEMQMLASGAKIDENLIKEGVKLLEPAKAAEFERRWRNLQLEELDLHRKRTELMSEHARCIVETYKSKLA